MLMYLSPMIQDYYLLLLSLILQLLFLLDQNLH